MKKFWKILSVSVIVLAVLAGIAGGVYWLLPRLRPVKAEIPERAVLAPASGIAPGMPVTATAVCKLPVSGTISRAVLECGKHSVATGDVEIRQKRHWDYKQYTVTARFFAVSGEAVAPGKLVVTVNLPKGEKSHTVEVPGFDVTLDPAVIAGGELKLADKMAEPKPEKPSRRLWLLLLLLLPVGALLWYFLRRRRRGKAAEATPWEIALAALEQLRLASRSGEMLPESGFARLTDVVRNYLEARFGLPASRRTTPEFLDELSRSMILPEERKPFLRDFLNAADRIKFARERSDSGALEYAVSKAEELVSGTVPKQGGKADV